MDEDSASYDGPSPDDFILAGKDIQNKKRRHQRGSKQAERRAFMEFFGTRAAIVSLIWRLLVENDLLPEKAQIKHLLWALFFMKVYPKQGPACSVVGGSDGAVDPKTLRKWVWLFISRIAMLEPIVVSFGIFHSPPLLPPFYLWLALTLILHHRLILKAGRIVAV